MSASGAFSLDQVGTGDLPQTRRLMTADGAGGTVLRSGPCEDFPSALAQAGACDLRTG